MQHIIDVPSFVLVDGFSHRHVGQCSSTNSALMELPVGHDRSWLTAGTQTQGKGRSGRSWTSENGNLFASVRLENPSAPEQAAGLSFVMALAARDAICQTASGIDAKLKWPNDILIDGMKLAGILLEAMTAPDGDITTVCGIGVNCRHAPASQTALYATTSLAARGYLVEPERLFVHLAKAFAERLSQWDRGKGMASICADWKQVSAGIGTQINARAGGTESHGIFRDITPEGHLLLETKAGVEVITAADIFLA
ncbi:MAG: biotin--[acetyl-CoA-carboxylase] ligase [Pseudomonadota bacterium]